MTGVPALPESTVPLLEDLVAGLRPLSPAVVGAWVFGSVALGAWDERTSDIDVIVLTGGPLSAEQVAQLAALHGRLFQDHDLAPRLEVQYLSAAAVRGEPVEPYPTHAEGRFQASGRGNLNATTRWVLRERGITLFGPPASDLPVAVTWDHVLAAMRYNLADYWPPYATPAALPFLRDDGPVVWTVATLCRILSTIEDGVIVDKRGAVRAWLGRVPEWWVHLLGEVHRLQVRSVEPMRYATVDDRARDVQSFVLWSQERGMAALQSRS